MTLWVLNTTIFPIIFHGQARKIKNESEDFILHWFSMRSFPRKLGSTLLAFVALSSSYNTIFCECLGTTFTTMHLAISCFLEIA